MKTLLISCAGLLATACQPQSSIPSATAGQRPDSTAVRVATTAPEVKTQPGPMAVGALPPELRLSLQTTDLSSLLQTVRKSEAYAQDGFFGPDHYHIQFAFTDVRRDPARPTVYYLRGKNRYKGVVTPFAGTFTVAQFGEQPYFTAREIADMAKQGDVLTNEPGYYGATGTFELREDSTRRGAGVFRGQLAIDWFTEKDGSRTLNGRGVTSASQGGLIKYEGTWTSAATHRSTPVVWVQNVFSYNAVKNVLKDFDIGERDVEINPKYAKLGWNNYWENDEWWADSKRMALAHSAAAPRYGVHNNMAVAPTIVADSVVLAQ